MSVNSSATALDRLDPALDRFREAHFWIHTLEQFYHYADPFRWHLNAFLKSLKEVPQQLQMGLQNVSGFPDWFRDAQNSLRADPLMKVLFDHRDFVVHRGMLVPDSYGTIGITEGSGIKLGIRFPLDPFEDSDDAMHRHLNFAAKENDFLGLLIPDEESLPCVHRVWRIPAFREEIVTLAAQAWLRTGETVDAVIRWLGYDPPGELSLDCRHSSQNLEYRLYDRDKLRHEFATIRETHALKVGMDS